ncbi:MAG: chromosomal replication initiator protein DnaA [Dehalococcoidales bacterium]|mgnify:CR=1 FL=1|jgi:chromosomal replication initiator protein|nr:chromosomal replication initiator protein DnaA [Dehalococcoidales bacterium]MDP6448966.1 chromosomal replication initiator protein DnaA [Dehalococcoidales bacterium]MDP6576977.1 chromosomal replication initiator protein DnaA [Dehalococcoidales bacterium]MDP6824879.1 chromosomal replication initiator protein DnaA [Dehalococcoidales bacterium]
MGTRPAQAIWNAALGELQVQVSKPNYRTWLEKTTGVSYQDEQFVVSAPNVFVAEYLNRNQRSLIEKTLIGITASPNIRIVFQVDGKYKNSSEAYATARKHSPAAPLSSSVFKSNYIFDTFIVGKGNHFAYAAAQEVALSPRQSYNPLFIYGGVGLGKTHLLHAIGQAVTAHHTNVICLSAEQFTNEFVNTVRERNVDEFRRKYRNADMLLVDDIHFISGKEQTEECFFHIFNELHHANRQVVLTSDQPPKSITSLTERLRSRFEWGLLVDIQLPDFETRLAILEAKVKQRGVEATLEILEFLARRSLQNIRELEGSLNRVIAYARLFQTAPTIELATRALENISDKEPESTASITLGLVTKAVADSFQLSVEDLKSRRRDKETALARRVGMYILRQETNFSVAQIGQELGGRDPSSVTNACQNITGDITANPYLRRKILDIQKRINSVPNPKSRRAK